MALRVLGIPGSLRAGSNAIDWASRPPGQSVLPTRQLIRQLLEALVEWAPRVAATT